jgi:PadR family transcriptional regulator, regulatory protein PadR
VVKNGKGDGQALKGLLDMLVLDVLSESDNYGYGILQRIGDHLDGDEGPLKERTLYPLLHRMEAKGFVDSYYQPGKRGTPRKYYRITKAGRGLLGERIEEWRRIVRLLERTVLPREEER